MTPCRHLSQYATLSPAPGVARCLKIGDPWVHLRLCKSCGHVGCCDSSKNKHATSHFYLTEHPIIKSHEPSEEWGYCYVDDAFFEAL